MALRENVPFPTDAGDGPEEKRADVPGYGGGERVKSLSVLTDGWDGGLRVHRKKVQSDDQLYERERQVSLRGKRTGLRGRGETDVESFCPLAGNDFGFDFAEAEKDAAAVTVDR